MTIGWKTTHRILQVVFELQNVTNVWRLMHFVLRKQRLRVLRAYRLQIVQIKFGHEAIPFLMYLLISIS